MPIPRALINSFKNANPVLSFSNSIYPTLSTFVSITTNKSIEAKQPSIGFNVKNVSQEPGASFYVKTTDVSHGLNDGFLLKIGESIFIKCDSLTKIQVKREQNTGISLQVIGY